MKNKKKLLSSFLVIVLILSALLTLVSCLGKTEDVNHPRIYMMNRCSGVNLSVRSIETKKNAEDAEYRVYHLRLHNETDSDVICPSEITFYRYASDSYQKEEKILQIEWSKGERYILSPGKTVDFKFSTDGFDLTVPGEYRMIYRFEINGQASRSDLFFEVFDEEYLEIIDIADKAFAEHYPDYPLSFFRIKISNYGDTGMIKVEYRMYVGEYRTNCTLQIGVRKDLSTYVFSPDEQDLMCADLIPQLTTKRVRDAENRLREQVKEYDEPKPVYMYFDDRDQTLYLEIEMIIDIEDAPEGMYGCDIDHKHLFFREAICSHP